ncbi:hypothetical protein BU25DRAFT_115126 [Macroventuria anomochaeta]|uniref:Uncharacterized protein n=1 Tax=Macroventuria anomochaeta TaxID=301207 RepID=A0ACB6RU76_9PLEO|nr:uncharacterized protein BU25DRAFT_115126 [Macroventuria anomochaeta]KAF2625530.1 hypothetical protein BU25DRAFT_115126 [Macroventuria anomochaeta]
MTHPPTQCYLMSGANQQTRPVMTNGCKVPATLNLADALLQQREQGIRMLWVDALYITQQDDTERAQQIQRMTTIYR